MYLHLGQETVVRERDIIGIFDLDNTTVSRHTRKTLNEAEKAAKVIVPDNQLSLAIGKEGQNARLAARLTGFKIDIKPESEA